MGGKTLATASAVMKHEEDGGDSVLVCDDLAFSGASAGGGAAPDDMNRHDDDDQNDDDGPSSPSLIRAKFRTPFLYKKTGTRLNVEWFGSDNAAVDDAEWPILAFVPGICESAETWTVQSLARACLLHKQRLVVLEYEGHGLSDGPRGVCHNFDRLVDQVVTFVHHIMSVATTMIRQQKKKKKVVEAMNNDNDVNLAMPANDEKPPIPFVLCGASLGGCLCAYAADRITSQSGVRGQQQQSRTFAGSSCCGSDVRDTDDDDNNTLVSRGLIGTILIAPAVGVAAEAVPPPLVVGALRFVSMLAPSTTHLSMTPVEDPTLYACPADSTRNFTGHWPLCTSRMLLDVTSTQVRHDQDTGALTLQHVPSVLVVAGERDAIVPLERIEDFVDKLKCQDKSLEVIPNADHGLMVNRASSKIAVQCIFDWIASRVEQQRNSKING